MDLVSEDALIGILAAVLAADVIVVVLALAWTRIRVARRSHAAARGPRTPPAGGASEWPDSTERGLRRMPNGTGVGAA